VSEDERPNLLYIHSDQHSPIVLGCYGDPVVRTPNLDRLARDGVLFESAHCPSPICVPSRMSALTGGSWSVTTGRSRSSLTYKRIRTGWSIVHQTRPAVRYARP